MFVCERGRDKTDEVDSYTSFAHRSATATPLPSPQTRLETSCKAQAGNDRGPFHRDNQGAQFVHSTRYCEKMENANNARHLVR